MGEELRAFSRLPWWYGGDPGKGTEYWRFLNPQGETVDGGRWAPHGRGRYLGIENEQMCFLIGIHGKVCDGIYRNPEGTRENNDEYFLRILGSDGGEWFIYDSVVRCAWLSTS